MGDLIVALVAVQEPLGKADDGHSPAAEMSDPSLENAKEGSAGADVVTRKTSKAQLRRYLLRVNPNHQGRENARYVEGFGFLRETSPPPTRSPQLYLGGCGVNSSLLRIR